MAATVFPGMVVQQQGLQDVQVLGYDRVQSPVPTRESWAEVSGIGTSSPEVRTFCPQPRRAFAPFEYPASPNSPWSNGDEGSRELQELLGNCPKVDCNSDTRPLSSVSTAYNPFDSRPVSSTSMMGGHTTSFDEAYTATIPWLQEGIIAEQRQLTPAVQTPQPAVQTPQPTTGFLPCLEEAAISQDQPAGPSETAQAGQGAAHEGPVQNRKVFVGGVPQEMTQSDLYNVFGAFGAVRKAWLQKCRAAGPRQTEKSGVPAQNHRGFGFVIFTDAATVNNLLGHRNFSRFLSLADGKKLEVKRAISSTTMGGEKASPGGSSNSSAQASGATGEQGNKRHTKQLHAGQRGAQTAPQAPVAGGQAKASWSQGPSQAVAAPAWPVPELRDDSGARPAAMQAAPSPWAYPVTGMCAAPQAAAQAAVAAAAAAQGRAMPPGNFHVPMSCQGMIPRSGVMLSSNMVATRRDSGCADSARPLVDEGVHHQPVNALPLGQPGRGPVAREASPQGADAVVTPCAYPALMAGLPMQGPNIPALTGPADRQALASMLLRAMPDHYDD
eukprot:TRINITY_DN64965_c0_g1_i1.p1 TRINITY_DN64965_c0_g1~~TRINITY_DN64965_c0_g1_i1.p1  ORF type:complete len:554 (+),score=88.47 TRINITY_DN64965_c0_g1_i1:73-1734(+)